MPSLKQMAEAKTGGIRKMTIFQIPEDMIHVRDGFNARNFDTEQNQLHVQELAVSIAKVGVLEPLTVTVDDDGSIYLVNGECRLRAVRWLKEQGAEVADLLPVMGQANGSNEDLLAAQLLRNSGKPFTLLEYADLFQRMRDAGHDNEAIGEKVGMTGERVRQILTLQRATKKVRGLIADELVTPTLAQRAIAEGRKPGDVERLLMEAVQIAMSSGRKQAKPSDYRRAKGETVSDGRKTRGQSGSVPAPVQRLVAPVDLDADTMAEEDDAGSTADMWESATPPGPRRPDYAQVMQRVFNLNLSDYKSGRVERQTIDGREVALIAIDPADYDTVMRYLGAGTGQLEDI